MIRKIVKNCINIVRELKKKYSNVAGCYLKRRKVKKWEVFNFFKNFKKKLNIVLKNLLSKKIYFWFINLISNISLFFFQKKKIYDFYYLLKINNKEIYKLTKDYNNEKFLNSLNCKLINNKW